MSRRDEGPFLVKLMSGEWVMAVVKRDTVSPTTLYLSNVLQVVERGPKVEFKQWCPLAPLDQTFVMNEFAVLTYLTPAPALVESYHKLVGVVMNTTTPPKTPPKAKAPKKGPPSSSAKPSEEGDKIIPLIVD